MRSRAGEIPTETAFPTPVCKPRRAVSYEYSCSLPGRRFAHHDNMAIQPLSLSRPTLAP